MKVVSYSLFCSESARQFEEDSYVRGFYFNCVMNKMVYPEWHTAVFYDRYIYEKYHVLFTRLHEKYSISGHFENSENLCKNMLWRMKPIFWSDITEVICRDTDALTSMREATIVNAMGTSNYAVMGIHDNSAHAGLMGGMSWFHASTIRERFGSYEHMIASAKRPIDKRGSDQDFLNDTFIYKIWKAGERQHGSDLCSAFIGSAGVNEMETLRYFFDHAPGFAEDAIIWKQYPKIFYWHE